MAKNTSILLGDYFENFINNQVKSGKYASASEVVRAALRLFEFEEWKKSELIDELKKGEESGFVRDKHFEQGGLSIRQVEVKLIRPETGYCSQGGHVHGGRPQRP